MNDQTVSRRWRLAVASIFLVPILHPLLIPWVGVPSHLLWWVHVLPIALFTFRLGRGAAFAAFFASALLTAGGEALFGRGYGVPADAQTVIALTAALSLTNLLVVAFARYARDYNERFRLLFERVGIGVVRVDPEGCILAVNPAAVALFGIPAESIVGKRIEEVLGARGLLSFDHLEERGGWSGELEVLAGGESAKTIHAVLAAGRISDGGGTQILIADRSTEVMHEQEIERQSKLAALGEALAGVAHELNNPLTAILAHAQLGLAQPDSDEVPELFEVIEHESERMRDIVGELLGYSRRAESDECEDLDALLDRLVRVQRIALGKAIRIEPDFAWPNSVGASSLKIEQIVLNLMSNAAYAVRSNRGKCVRVSSRRAGDCVEIEVRDDGPGIDPSIVGRLFEPFATTKPEGEGTGLGLAISRRLARGWGGDLTVRNVEPHGAAFTLRLRVPTEAAGSGVRIA